MTISWRDLVAAAVASVLASGCGTAPPGAGFTSGDKATFTSDEKPAVRDDLHMPSNPNTGDAPLAESAATSPAATGNNAGTGGRNGGQAGNPPATGAGADAEGAKPASSPAGSSANPPATPPKIESSGEAGAQGGTKPPGQINEGTPRSPQ